MPVISGGGGGGGSPFNGGTITPATDPGLLIDSSGVLDAAALVLRGAPIADDAALFVIQASDSGGTDLFEVFSSGGVNVILEAAGNDLRVVNSVGVLQHALGLGLAGFYGTAPVAKPTVTGSKGANAALTSLCTALATLGLITNTTT